MAAVRSGPTVGRDLDSATLDAAIEVGTSPIIVQGDAGIGKTRFINDAVDRQRALGRITLLGNCLPMSRPLPLHPIAEALRGLLHLDGGRALSRALASCAPYVNGELARLVPSMSTEHAPVDTVSGGGNWERERLFAAVAEIFEAVADNGQLIVAIEDLHWADQTSVDMLTYIHARFPAPATGARLLVTCRVDEPRPPYVARWLTNARRLRPVEIRLRGLTRDSVCELVEQLVGTPPPSEFVDDLFLRTAGNPFFVEQVLASSRRPFAATAVPVPAALAALLAQRVEDISQPAREVLTALGVVRRAVPEPLVLAITGMDAEAARRALHELEESKLLAEGLADGYAPRHALLAEAVTISLLPSERRGWHARTARALEADSERAAAAEVAWHWHRAGSPVDELRATARAAAAAASVFAYSEAAELGQRAIELFDEVPPDVDTSKPDARELYLQTIAAIEACGRQEDAAELAERAFRRYADDNDVAATAELRTIVAYHRRVFDHQAALHDLAEAIGLFEQLPPCRAHAYALLQRGRVLRLSGDTRASVEPLRRALDIVRHVDAIDIEAECLVNLGLAMLRSGDIATGLDLMTRARSLLSRLVHERLDLAPALVFALWASDAELKLGRLSSAERLAVEGLSWAHQSGRAHTFTAACVVGKAVEALLEQGQSERAQVLLVGHTTAQPQTFNWVSHSCRAVTELRMGKVSEAHARMESVVPATKLDVPEMDRELAESYAEVAIWTRRPSDVGPMVRRAAGRCEGTDDEPFWGELLVLGAQAAADMAEQARARRDPRALERAIDALADVEGVADRMHQRPFADHPFVARIPADRAQWDAERQRARGEREPQSWLACAQLWERLGRPHRAAYAWWRCAEALLESGRGSSEAAEPLRRAAELSVGMVPLLDEINALATRARVSLADLRLVPRGAAAAGSGALATAAADARTGGADPYGLTSRERAVLRLVAAGRTNAQIGAELFISHKTASVHVTNILRKLGVDNRTQAAALAERAGLLRDGDD